MHKYGSINKTGSKNKTTQVFKVTLLWHMFVHKNYGIPWNILEVPMYPYNINRNTPKRQK